MSYYAHKKGIELETLEEHSIKTAELCSKYTSKFNNEKIGFLLGLLHDIGKATPLFQDVLFGRRTKINHSLSSALAFYKYDKQNFLIHKYNNKVNVTLRNLLCYIIESHHSGLSKDKFEIPADISSLIDERVLSANTNELLEELICLISEYITLYNITEITDTDYFSDINSMSICEKMLYARMLLSGLVDADYTATTIFSDNFIDVDHILDVDTFISLFDSYYNELVHKVVDSPLNRLRTKVYNDCANKGSIQTGLCTLTAPTGLGKTLSLMKFALENAKAFNKDRIFIVLPWLSIIEQNAKIYKDIFGEDNVLIINSVADLDYEKYIESHRWNAPIIVTTSNCFFETLMASKTTNLRPLHRVCNSVVVFDEVQSFPADLLSCTFDNLNALTKYFNTTVLLSSATQPQYALRLKDNEINNKGRVKQYRTFDEFNITEIISDVDTLYSKYAHIKGMKTVIKGDMSCKDLYDSKDSQVMYVFNTVKYAQEMYDYLITQENAENCYCLNSNLCALDKLFIIEEIKQKLRQGKRVFLATTQCVEAGVDFSFEKVYRNYAPLDAIIQTAGRCDRECVGNGIFVVFNFNSNNYENDKFPSELYKTASNISKSILQKNSTIYKNSLVNAYYKIYFTCYGANVDNTNITESIKTINFKDLSDAYKLIKQDNNCVVIVGSLFTKSEKYDTIIEEIKKQNTITKSQIKQLASYSVNVYKSKAVNINEIATPLKMKIHNDIVDTNYYLLFSDVNYDKKGLDLKIQNDFIF